MRGEGCVPEICILEPPINNGVHKMEFNPLLLECVSSKQLSIQNTGTVPIKILLEILDDVNDKFSLISKSNIKTNIIGSCWEGNLKLRLLFLVVIPGELRCYRIFSDGFVANR